MISQRVQRILSYYALTMLLEPVVLMRSLGAGARASGGGVTDHGSLTGLGDDDHTQYYNSARHTKALHTALGLFPTDGSEAMTGNLDLASYALLTTNLLLKEHNSSYLAVRNRTDAWYRSMLMNKLGLGGQGTEPDASTCLLIDTTLAGPITAWGQNSGGNVIFYVTNNSAANVNNQACFSAQCKNTDGVRRQTFGFGSKFTDIVKATRTAETIFWSIENAVGGDVFKLSGLDCVFPQLTGAGNAYAYLDANGKLCRGAAYP